MSTITQEAPRIDNNSSDGPKLPDYPSLPSDIEMKSRIIDMILFNINQYY